MFYKIGFYVLLVLVILFGWVAVKSNPMTNMRAFVWTEFYSENPAETLAFLQDNFGISVVSTSENMLGGEYNVIQKSGALWPFAGVMDLPTLPDGSRVPPHTIIYLTVTNFDSAHDRIVAAGAIAHVSHKEAGGMKFGIYTIPGGLVVGVAEYSR